jgi:hypothetical protein
MLGSHATVQYDTGQASPPGLFMIVKEGSVYVEIGAPSSHHRRPHSMNFAALEYIYNNWKGAESYTQRYHVVHHAYKHLWRMAHHCRPPVCVRSFSVVPIPFH